MDENEDKMTARERERERQRDRQTVREKAKERERERIHSITPILNLPSHTTH